MREKSPLNILDLANGNESGKTTSPLYLSPVSAGFPSATDDYIDSQFNLHEFIVRNSAATFFLRASGDSMLCVGIHDATSSWWIAHWRLPTIGSSSRPLTATCWLKNCAEKAAAFCSNRRTQATQILTSRSGNMPISGAWSRMSSTGFEQVATPLLRSRLRKNHQKVQIDFFKTQTKGLFMPLFVLSKNVDCTSASLLRILQRKISKRINLLPDFFRHQ